MKPFNKKGMAAACASACVGLMITGTFAWNSVTFKTNEFIGTRGIVLHDDFDPDYGKKDVYVENVSNRYLFVRVKLGEYMDLTTKNKPEGIDDLERYNEFYENHFNPSMIADNDCTLANALGEKFHDYFIWNMGGSKFYYPATAQDHELVDSDPYGDVFTDKNDYDAADGIIKETPNAAMILMADYMAKSDNPSDENSKQNFVGWIYDPKSGDPYAYWSQPLGAPIPETKVSTVTGLLLNGVKTNPFILNSDYYYAIRVVAEAVDNADLPMWTEEDSEAPGMGQQSIDKSGLRYQLASRDMIAVLKDIIAPIANAAPAPTIPAASETP
ncbi:MAG: hypothetical protein LBU32_10530 [Clostridiales bacterium]|jgi:hypothetical protein|nr:hypothetical protein [Clostridiales bacterium]